MKQNKAELRKEILKQRQTLSKAEWQTKNNLICDRLKTLSLFKQANTIFAYFSFRQEADLSSLFSLEKNWVFPRCVNQSLVWHLWQPGESLITDQYGIQTPRKNSPIIPISSADLMLVPTVACDRQGYRLGYGGGFYDRLLSSAQGSIISTVGIVFDFAYIAQLPVDPWDLKLDFICSETKFLSNI
jgi:5-formyltetrahydrofolate cyclo-ligase